MKITLLILTLTLGKVCNSQSVTGKVTDIDTKKTVAEANVYLTSPSPTEDTLNVCYWSMYKYKIISQTKTDLSGNYSFISVKPSLYSLVVSFKMPEVKDLGSGYRDDIDSNINLNSSKEYTRDFQLLVTCPYDKTRNQLFCPNCKKKDKVFPIIWGLPMFDENGKINGLSDGKYVLGGCIMDLYCNPTKFCKRCRKNF